MVRPSERIKMREWKALKSGDRISFHWNDFDGYGVAHGRVTEVSTDHAVARIDGNNYWIDDETQNMFSKGWV